MKQLIEISNAFLKVDDLRFDLDTREAMRVTNIVHYNNGLCEIFFAKGPHLKTWGHKSSRILIETADIPVIE